MTLRLCTLTGVDEKTSFDWIVDTAGFGFVEFGILLSLTPEDKDARYSEIDFIMRFADHAQRYGVNTALHVCGSAVNHFVLREDPFAGELVRGLAARFGRVQLNFNLGRAPFSLLELDEAIRSFSRPVITQHFPANSPVTEGITAPNHHVLFDASGGRGIHSTAFPERLNSKYHGYAGGFGPETIIQDIVRAKNAAAGTPFWVDMESKIRTEGYLDMALCTKLLSQVNDFIYHEDH